MIGSVLIFALVLSILIVVHELGHFLVARKLGVWVEEFGIGLPPRLWGKKIGETIYSINALPFGGFVRLHGESSEDGVSDPKRAFLNQSKKVRTAIVVAGVAMNFLLAILAFSIVYTFSGIPQDSKEVRVVDIVKDSPASGAGFVVGDIVLKVDKTEVSSTSQFVSEVEKEKGKKITLEIKRGEETKKISVTPRADPPEGQGPLGVVITTSKLWYPPLWQRPFVGIYYGFKDALFWGKQIIFGFADFGRVLLYGRRLPPGVAGPFGIYAVTSEVAKVGVLALINFLGLLSVNLAILNIFPFPALDGGRLLFIGIESILGRKVLPKIEAMAHTFGMILLILFLLAITARDIRQVLEMGFSEYVNSIVR